MQWHEANEGYLINRRPVASVAVGYSRKNADYFGRDNTEELVAAPWRGFTQALVRGRIPYVPMDLGYLDRDGADYSVLVLANVGGISDEEAAAIRRFVQRGGALVATGQTSLFDEWGQTRGDFALADLFGVKGGKPMNQPVQPLHSYLRLTPDMPGKRHAVLAGFEETNILPYGGTLGAMSVVGAGKALVTYVPPVPSSPPETVWMRTPRTEIPGVVVNESAPGRVVYFAADIDRRFAADNFPDHGDLLANAVRWAGGSSIPLEVRGAGLINCELYRQENRMILHLVNLTSAGTWRAPVEELIGIGPLQVRVRVGGTGSSARISRLVAGGASTSAKVDGEWAAFEIDRVVDHEVVVITA
jgi:hypothetical protein